MDVSKDYYATLGVLPSAEDYIVQAAYKALCKRFHPDVYKGADAHERMAAINEAYEVLGDSSKRAEYDRRRGETTSDDSDFFNDDFDQSKRDVDPFEEDWKVAVEYYPEVVTIAERLEKTSARLAFTFRAYILLEKEYEQATEVADLMERNFLNQFFGTSTVSHTFARELTEAGRKDVLQELNKTIKVLGSGSGERVVNNLREKHQIFNAEQLKKQKEEQIRKKKEAEAAIVRKQAEAATASRDASFARFSILVRSVDPTTSCHLSEELFKMWMNGELSDDQIKPIVSGTKNEFKKWSVLLVLILSVLSVGLY